YLISPAAEYYEFILGIRIQTTDDPVIANAVAIGRKALGNANVGREANVFGYDDGQIGRHRTAIRVDYGIRKYILSQNFGVEQSGRHGNSVVARPYSPGVSVGE